MRVVVQRVRRASVEVKQEMVGKIEKGLFVLLGVEEADSQEDAEVLANKLSKLRIMADGKGKMNLSVGDVEGQILVVSQFTLHADTSAGNRPSFIKAANPKKAEKLYMYFIEYLKNLGVGVQTGKFGAYMNISVNLDGPVTIIIDSKK